MEGRPGPMTEPLESMDELREQVAALGELAQQLFEQQFIRCGGRNPADPAWDELEEYERDEWWDQAIDAQPLLAEKDLEIARLHTWHGLMSLLDEHYPPSVFDGSSGDEGARIVALVREVHRLRREVEFEANPEEFYWAPPSPSDPCVCVSDEQAARLPPGFSRPVCAVHPEGGESA